MMSIMIFLCWPGKCSSSLNIEQMKPCSSSLLVVEMLDADDEREGEHNWEHDGHESNKPEETVFVAVLAFDQVLH